MKHHGNVSKINGAEVEPVDIITFGSPCQDLSVAGKGAGIQDGERSNLFFEAIRIINEMREATNDEYPKYAVWENVPGAFSSNKGHDFHAVLEAFCSVCDGAVSIPKPYDKKRTDKLVWNKAGEIVGDNYSIAWRTLDAQYWGVPQRRKRIYLVADFTGRRAGEILFKPESLRGNIAKSNEAGEGATTDAVGSVDGSAGNGIDRVIPINDKATRHNGGGDTRRNDGAGNGLGVGKENDPSPTVTAADRHAVCFTMQRSDEYQACEVASTQSARQYKSATDLVVERKRKYIIRRLTPTECARLQGFPDWWSELAPYNPDDAEFWEEVRKTDLEIRGKKHRSVKSIEKWYEKLHTDTAEYKMWGNGLALPNAEYVLRGIAEHDAKTLGSLFDGSGGFPLAGVLNGIKPIWASEILPYPIAVTKSRFKEVNDG